MVYCRLTLHIPWLWQSSSLFSFTRNVGSQLWVTQRDEFSQACDHFRAFSLCHFILLMKGCFLFASINNHDCEILHLDGEWVVNGFVNLSMEKLPWYPCSFSATEFDTYLTYRIDVLELTSKEVKSSTLIHYFSPHLFHEYKCALRDLPCQKHNCFKYNREYHFRIKHLLFF